MKVDHGTCTDSGHQGMKKKVLPNMSCYIPFERAPSEVIKSRLSELNSYIVQRYSYVNIWNQIIWF